MPYQGRTAEVFAFLGLLCNEAIVEGDIFIQATFQDKSNQYFSEEFVSEYLSICATYVTDNMSYEYKELLLGYFPSQDQLDKYIIKKFDRNIKLKVLAKQ